jgi:hypothetical protein
LLHTVAIAQHRGLVVYDRYRERSQMLVMVQTGSLTGTVDALVNALTMALELCPLLPNKPLSHDNPVPAVPTSYDAPELPPLVQAACRRDCRSLVALQQGGALALSSPACKTAA